MKFLDTLFTQLAREETDDDHRRNLVFFLKEFCTFSQTLQQPNRESFYKVKFLLTVFMSPLTLLTSILVFMTAKNTSSQIHIM